MRGGLLALVGLLVLVGVWSSLELYAGMILPAREAQEEGFQGAGAGPDGTLWAAALLRLRGGPPRPRREEPSAERQASCEALAAAGRCLEDMRRVFAELRCEAACVARRSLPREARPWTPVPRCDGSGLRRLAPGAAPPLDPSGYLQLVGGREQMNKNKLLVLDALFYAKALNRTFVEPAVADSRIVRPPPDPRSAALPAAARHAWQRAYERAHESARLGREHTRPSGNVTLGFGSYWEMGPVCRQQRTLELPAFKRLRAAHALRSVLVLPASPGAMRIGGLRLATKAQVAEAFRPFRGYALIQLDSFYRSHLPRGVRLRLSSGVERFAARLARELLGARYMAVQWRSELVPTAEWARCAAQVAAAVRSEARRLGLGGGQVLLLSDVFPHTSGTDRRNAASRDLALRALERRVPGVTTHPIHAALASIGDTGIRAITEQFLAVRAQHFFAASLGSSRCAKPNSGFVNTIVAERRSRGHESRPLVVL